MKQWKITETNLYRSVYGIYTVVVEHIYIVSDTKTANQIIEEKRRIKWIKYGDGANCESGADSIHDQHTKLTKTIVLRKEMNKIFEFKRLSNAFWFASNVAFALEQRRKMTGLKTG